MYDRGRAIESNRSVIDERETRKAGFRLDSSRKVVLLVLLFTLIVVTLIGVLYVSGNIFAGVRSYVRGEGLWAKAQKEAVSSLNDYIHLRTADHLTEFHDALGVIQGYKKARIALLQAQPDRAAAREGFLQGGSHPDEVQDMIWFFTYFQDVSYMREAISIWTEGDNKIDEVISLGKEIEQSVATDTLTPAKQSAFRERLRRLDRILRQLEVDFSAVLSEGARWVRNVVLVSSLALVGLFLGIGTIVSWQIIRSINRAENEVIKSEASYRGILVNLVDTYYRVNEDGRLTRVSPSAATLLGFSEDELLGCHLSQFFFEPRDYMKLVRKLRRNGGRISRARARLRHKNGEAVWVSTSASIFSESGGASVGVEGIAQDITKQLESVRKIVESQERAEEANKAKSEFLASMSHELRTPLNAVLGFAQMLQMGSLSEKQEDQVESILYAGNHLLRLVNDVLDLARIEANELELSFEAVEVRDIVSECVSLISPLGTRHEVAIVNDVSTAPVLVVEADRLRLKQALINLLSNAVKFNTAGGTVRVEQTETADGFVRISVLDTGIGIAADDFDSVFVKFHRVGADAMTAREGTGIGLAVCKLLVEQMDGRIGFESVLGQGSTFWIDLPHADISATPEKPLVA